MAKKAQKDQQDGGETAERLLVEIAGLVYAAYGFDPASLPSLPSDSAVRTSSPEDARATLLRLGVLTRGELSALPLEAATNLALQRLTDEGGGTGSG
jgi:hypothetical protein